MEVDYGNVGWQVYVAAAYLVSLAVLLGYTAFQWKSRLQTIRSLKEEGFLDDNQA